MPHKGPKQKKILLVLPVIRQMSFYFLGRRALSMHNSCLERQRLQSQTSLFLLFFPWASYCWAWQLAVWNIHLVSLVKLSQLCSPTSSCPPQAYSERTWGGERKPWCCIAFVYCCNRYMITVLSTLFYPQMQITSLYRLLEES